MTIITRRQALTRLGATSAAATIGGGATIHAVEAAAPTRTENPELFRLHEQLTAQLAERAAAEAEIARIADEWRDRWPLAPEDLLGIVIRAKERAYDDGVWRVERDIAGGVLFRDPSMLSRRTARRYRDDLMAAPVAFYIEKTDHIEKQLRDWENMPPKGRTPAALARHTKWVAGVISNYRSRLRLARQYDYETARLLDVSGMNVARARLASVNTDIDLCRERLSREDAWTYDGLRLKARVLHEEMASVGDGWWLDPEIWAGTCIGRMHRLALQLADAA